MTSNGWISVKDQMPNARQFGVALVVTKQKDFIDNVTVISRVLVPIYPGNQTLPEDTYFWYPLPLPPGILIPADRREAAGVKGLQPLAAKAAQVGPTAFFDEAILAKERAIKVQQVAKVEQKLRDSVKLEEQFADFCGGCALCMKSALKGVN